MINLSLSSAKTRYCILFLLLMGSSFHLSAQKISTVMGGAIGDGKPATTIGIVDAPSLESDSANNLYLLDAVNNRVRKIDPVSGIITTVVGNGDYHFAGDGGLAVNASINSPMSIALDRQGNIYLGDGSRIRKVDAVTGIINTIVGTGKLGFSGDGGPAVNAEIGLVFNIDLDNAGNIYFVDGASVRKVDAATGIITTVVGTRVQGYSGNGGPATSAQIGMMPKIAVDSAGNIFICEIGLNAIRKITAATGLIDVYAGIPYSPGGHSGDLGPATSANIGIPADMDVDKYGNLYFTNANNRIRKINAADGSIETIAGIGVAAYLGDGGPALSAAFDKPQALSINRNGNIYVWDYNNFVVRTIDNATNTISTIAGNQHQGFAGMGGSLDEAQLFRPSSMAIDSARNIYIAGYNRIYLASIATNTFSVFAGTGSAGVGQGNGGLATNASISGPSGLVVDKTGNLYFLENGVNLRKIDASTSMLSTIAGNNATGYAGDGGPATGAQFNQAGSLAIDKEDNIYIVDGGNARIRKITVATGDITTVAGNGVSNYTGDGGLATAASLHSPKYVAVDNDSNLYISEGTSNSIRKVDAVTGIITTIVGGKGMMGPIGFGGDGGPAAAATVAFPTQVSFDKDGNLYFADGGNDRVRRIDKATGIITTVAGTGGQLFNGDDILATNANLYSPQGIAFDKLGNWYIAEYGNHRIRKVTPSSQLKVIAFYDDNGNGIKDLGEKPADGIKVNLSKDDFNRTLFTKNGIALLDAEAGSYSIYATAALYFTAELSSETIEFTDTARVDSVFIAVTSFPGEKDMQVSLLALDPARPGFDMHYRIFYKNTGTSLLTNIPLTFIKNSKANFVSSTKATSTTKGDTLTWVLPTLQPRDTGIIDIYTKLATPPVASIGDILHSYVYVKIPSNLTMDDDTARIKQVVTGAYDPNDKTELHKGTLTPTQLYDGEYLTYLVRFQNTGNDTAFNVEVRDTLDVNLDWESFQMIAASHDYSLSIEDGNHLSWKFNNIKLPDSNVNEKASHGFVSFRIRANWDMDPNDTVRNTCAIYFDHNPAIITNTTSTAIKELPVLPPVPALNAAIANYCAVMGDQQFKITNLPATSSTTSVKARLNATLLTIAADSTITLSPQQLGSGNYSVNIEYTNDAGGKSTSYPFTITAAVNPDVDLGADKIQISAPAEKVTFTATNKKDGGSSPLYTFAKDKAFANILQAESSSNKFILDGDSYANGDIWVYVRMKTSEACFVSATNIDSIKINKNVVTTGIVDADNPLTIIMGYPNPFYNQVVVGGLSLAKTYRVYVYDNLGRLVHQQMIYNRSSIVIPATGWKTGAYWITLFDHRKNKLLGSIPVTKQ